MYLERLDQAVPMILSSFSPDLSELGPTRAIAGHGINVPCCRTGVTATFLHVFDGARKSPMSIKARNAVSYVNQIQKHFPMSLVAPNKNRKRLDKKNLKRLDIKVQRDYFLSWKGSKNNCFFRLPSN